MNYSQKFHAFWEFNTDRDSLPVTTQQLLTCGFNPNEPYILDIRCVVPSVFSTAVYPSAFLVMDVLDSLVQ